MSGWQHTQLEDVGNCWEGRILNFNLRTLISPELVIYLGMLSTKSSLTTGHKYIYKQPSCLFYSSVFLMSSIRTPGWILHVLTQVGDIVLNEDDFPSD